MSRWFRSYGFAQVLDDLIVGAYPLDQGDVDTLAHMGIERVLNLSEDEEYRPGDREEVERALADAGIAESRMPLTDYGGLTPDELEQAVRTVAGWLADGESTYLHCRAGWQRSATVAAGVVAVRSGIGIDEALEVVQERKPSADPLPHQREDLRRWWEGRREASAGDPTPAAGDPAPSADDPMPAAGDPAPSAGDSEPGAGA